jgi:hypothetical protein
MNEKQLLTKMTLPNVFVNTLVGLSSGLLGTMVLGLILLLTWSIVGEVLVPTSSQTTTEFGEVLSYKQNTHPLFLSVVIWGVFMATMAANILHTLLITSIEERYTARATCITQVAVGNVVILLLIIPVYIMVSSQYGANGVAIAALIHSTLSAIFSALVLEIVNLKKYILVSMYGVMAGLILFFLSFILFGNNSPTIMAFVVLPLLLGMMSLGKGITQLIYFWFADTYGNDFLDIEKRYGADYGREEVIEDTDDFSEEFGEF